MTTKAFRSTSEPTSSGTDRVVEAGPYRKPAGVAHHARGLSGCSSCDVGDDVPCPHDLSAAWVMGRISGPGLAEAMSTLYPGRESLALLVVRERHGS